MSIAMLQGLCWDPNDFSVQEIGFWLLAHFGYIILAVYYFERRWDSRYYVFVRCRKKDYFFQSIWRYLLIITLLYNGIIFFICKLLSYLDGEQISIKQWGCMLGLTFFSEIAITSIQTWLCVLVKRRIVIYALVIMYEIMGVFSFSFGKLRLFFIGNYGMLVRCKGYSNGNEENLVAFSESLVILIVICAASYLVGNLVFEKVRRIIE